MLSTNDQREAKGRTNEFSNFPADRTDARVNQVNVSPLFASTSSPFLFRFPSCAHHGLNLRIWMYCLLLSRCTLIEKIISNIFSDINRSHRPLESSSKQLDTRYGSGWKRTTEFWKPCTDQFFVLERVQAKVGVRDYEVTAVARSAGNRMEVSTSAVTLQRPISRKTSKLTIDPGKYFIRLEFFSRISFGSNSLHAAILLHPASKIQVNVWT